MSDIERQPVASSNIRSVGYCPDTKRMHVEFKGGTVYEYSDVPADTHAALVGAKSIGGHLAAHIIGKYKAQRL